MRHGNHLLIPACAVLALAAFASGASAETKGPVTDDMGVLVIPKGAPIQIGAYWVMSGADSALGIDEKRGVEIAIKDHGGMVAGHPVKLNVEDDQCNAEGGQTAATKLAANPNTAILIGPACSRTITVRRNTGRISQWSWRAAPWRILAARSPINERDAWVANLTPQCATIGGSYGFTRRPRCSL